MNNGSGSVGGSSKIELDARLLNSLLSVFVNQPGGLQVQLDPQGQLQVQQGDLKVALEAVTLSQVLRLQLSKGQLGPFQLQVNQLQLGPQGVSVALQLQ